MNSLVVWISYFFNKPVVIHWFIFCCIFLRASASAAEMVSMTTRYIESERKKKPVRAFFYLTSAKYDIVATRVMSDITTVTPPSIPWKQLTKVLCPIKLPIKPNKALIVIDVTTMKATGSTTVSSVFPMYWAVLIAPRERKHQPARVGFLSYEFLTLLSIAPIAANGTIHPKATDHTTASANHSPYSATNPLLKYTVINPHPTTNASIPITAMAISTLSNIFLIHNEKEKDNPWGLSVLCELVMPVPLVCFTTTVSSTWCARR